MDDSKNYNPAEAETLDSREVAEMVEKNHKDLLRDIRLTICSEFRAQNNEKEVRKMDLEYHRVGDYVEARASGTAKEIAALVLELQGRRARDAVMLVRKPYQRTYSVVNLGSGRESSRDAK